MSIQPDNRFVDPEPWSDAADISAPERADFDAPSYVLIWRKFRRHKLGLISGLFLLLCYLILPVAGFAGAIPSIPPCPCRWNSSAKARTTKAQG